MEIDAYAIFDSFLLVTILAILIERSLALLFEHRLVEKLISNRGIKEIIAFGVCFAVCRLWCIDVISLMLREETGKNIGYILTAAAIAGGSKASIKMFKQITDIRKE